MDTIVAFEERQITLDTKTGACNQAILAKLFGLVQHI